MGKIASGLLGGLLSIVGIGSKAPSVSDSASKSLDADQATSKTARASLYATEGGVSGQELMPDQVKKRPTLLGN